MTKFEVYINCGLGNLGQYRLERIIEAKNTKEALDIAYEDNSPIWRYIKKVKEENDDE